MPDWTVWTVLAGAGWFAVAVVAGLAIGRFVQAGGARPIVFATAGGPTSPPPGGGERVRSEPPSTAVPERRKVLIVDDDPPLRLLLRTTLPASEFAVEEAESAESAAEIAQFFRPEVVVLDVGLPGVDGISFCRDLKRMRAAPTVILLTGADLGTDARREAGADAILQKPFSPIELMRLIDRVTDWGAPRAPDAAAGDEQLLLYARDLSRLVERERHQRRLLEQAYRETVTALADALEAKDPATGLHGRRVQRYALELAAAVDERLVSDPSLEYGFLLHDVGKIGIPEAVLRKPGALDAEERRLMQGHPLIGIQILRGIPLLEGAGLDVVLAHHERWDGTGYPHGLAGREIPIGARIFAVADALDAITTDRPYRQRRSWDTAIDEILGNSGTQFDPRVVAAFAAREPQLRSVAADLADRAA